MKSKIILILIILLAFTIRIYGLNWDQGQHLHPDERFMTMVASDIRLPNTISEYFSTSTSPLNPANKNYNFYVYGTFPLLITRVVAEMFNWTQYDSIFIIGRILSSVFDSLVILIIYFIAKTLKIKTKIIFTALIFYALSILPIQLSHFFTVDTFTVFFSTLTVFLFLKFYDSKNMVFLIASGLTFGLTLANKISIGITLPLFVLFIALPFPPKQNQGLFKSINYIIIREILFLLAIFLSFRIFQPYAFNGLIKFSENFLSSINIAHQMVTGGYDYPPNVQWKNTIPVLHPLLNIFLFGLGPIMTLLSIFGIYKLKPKKNKKINLLIFFLICFSALIFFYQGIQLAKYMRYFYPIYPFLILFAAIGFSHFDKFYKLKITLIILISLNTFFFLNIYSNPHSRISASSWICQNVPQESNISNEIWDDSLPINFGSYCDSFDYKSVSLSPYDTKTPESWYKFNEQLPDANYLVLSSNRAWGSISKDTNNYPNTSQFYKNLFDDQLSFKKIKTIYSYPGVSLPFIKDCLLIGPNNYPSNYNKFSFFEFDSTCTSPGVYFRDNIAEESFTVYDHPEVIIYKNN